MAEMVPAVKSAQQTALELPEILEQVLRHLPPTELLLAQRTSKLWHAVIGQSPRLQRQLFMRADWHFEGRKKDPRSPIYLPGDRPVNNLMLRSVLGGMYPRMTLIHPEPPSTEDEAEDEEAEESDSSDSDRQKHFSWDICVSVPANRLDASRTTDPAIHYEHASWRKMFLSQPPATSLHLCRRWQRSPQPALECKEGIRMSQVMERASRTQQAWSEVFIGSDRDWHLEGPINFSHFASIRSENPALDRAMSVNA